MELHYRGAVYNHVEPVVEMAESHLVTHYRGGIARLRQPKQAVASAPVGQLKYRGAWVR